MTMIAFQTTPTAAYVMTDSVGYTPRCVVLTTTTKVLPIATLDAVVATQGSVTFGNYAKAALLDAASHVTGFDELVRLAPQMLRHLHAEVQPTTPGFVALVGYSEDAGRFRGYVLPTEDDYEPQTHDDGFVWPAPWSVRPSDLEHDRFHAHLTKDEQPLKDTHAQALGAWRSREPLQPLVDVDKWIELAGRVQEERSTHPFGHVLVAGDIRFAVVQRGSVHIDRLGAYDDSPERQQKTLAGTLHPIGQAAPCPCGTGRAYIQCCAIEYLEDECGCGSGVRFGSCHSILRQGKLLPAS